MYNNFKQAKAQSLILDTAVDDASNKLKAIASTGKLGNGLVSDAVKGTNEYRIAKAEYDVLFARLRSFNAVYVKLYAKDLAAERKLRRA